MTDRRARPQTDVLRQGGPVGDTAPQIRAEEPEPGPPFTEGTSSPSATTSSDEPHPTMDDPAVQTRRERGAVVGRYLVLEQIGSGGMGAVYAAYDPELDRRVALKLVSAPDAARDGEGRNRLLREAQALAQLRHPNVVSVYDVGTCADEVFFAMELVEGSALPEWLTAGERGWRQIVAVFEQVCHGLAAAHAQGLVHRDVKPANILVANDGSARIIDFGIVRHVGRADEPATAVRSDERPPVNLLGAPLTRAGVFHGTLPYMAPEQLRGEPGDYRSDQFCLCASLYHALFGVLPWGAELRSPESEPMPPPKNSPVPGWLRRVVMRGLSLSPSARFEGMRSLASALARDPTAARRRWLLRAGVVAAALGVGLFLRWRSPTHACRAGDPRIIALWNDERRRAVEAAFAGTRVPFAADTFERVDASLKSYLDAWSAMRTDACEATHDRGTQSEELLDLRMDCLSQRLGHVRSTVDVLARADAGVVRRAVDTVLAIPELEGCANVRGLRAPAPPPGDATVRARIDAANQKLAEVRTLRAAGKHAEAWPLALALVEQAKELDYLPLTADALHQQGELYSKRGELKKAEETLHEAAALAETSGHDEAAVKAWTALLGLVGYDQDHPADGLLLGRHAEALLDRIGDNGIMRVRWQNQMGIVYLQQGRNAEAMASFRRGLETIARQDRPLLKEKTGLLSNTALMLFEDGKLSEAVVVFRQALEAGIASSGPMHPNIALLENNLGTTLDEAGLRDEGMAHLERALAIAEASAGKQHPFTALAILNIGASLSAQGEHDRALVQLRRALEMNEAIFGPDSADRVGRVCLALGVCLRRLGRFAEAESVLLRGRALYAKNGGPDAPKVAELTVALGDLYLDQGLPKRALAAFDDGRTTYERKLGAAHLRVGDALEGLGRARLAAGDAPAAIETLEQVLVLYSGLPRMPRVAQAEFSLARALAAARRDPARAEALARSARVAFEGARMAPEVTKVDRWLAGDR